jgi:hypothetical protein
LDYFDAFIRRCQLTPSFVNITTELLPVINSSDSLRNLTVAIGALDASRRTSVTQSSGQGSPRYIAFSSYGRSLSALKYRLTAAKAEVSEDVLWGTFLLVLFEVGLLPEAFHLEYCRKLILSTADLRLVRRAMGAAHILRYSESVPVHRASSIAEPPQHKALWCILCFGNQQSGFIWQRHLSLAR